jgi:hypothetical protein
MRITVTAAAALAALSLAACGGGSSQASGDGLACKDYAAWVSDGGPGGGFGSYTALLDSAVTAAGAVPGSDAKAILAGLPSPPAGNKPARLLWDLSNVQSDAEGDTAPPDGWSQEVAAVQGDCAAGG